MGNQGSINKTVYEENALQGMRIIEAITSRLDTSVFRIEELLSTVQSNSQRSNIEPRFSTIEYPLDTLSQNEESLDKVAVWCGLMVKQVFSTTFNYFVKDEFDENEAKCFASESILYNFIRLSKWTDLNQEQMEEIDRKLKEIILPYIKEKYPQSKSSEVNLAFNSKVDKIDNLENNSNDLFFRSSVKFQFSEEKQYDSKIMQFLNYIIQVPASNGQMKQIYEEYEKKLQSKKNSFFFEKMMQKKILKKKSSLLFKEKQIKLMEQLQEEEEKNTLYEDFEEFFTQLFEKLYSKKKVLLMEKGQNSDINEEKTEKTDAHKQKVQSYTNFFIHQKLSPNIEKFTPEKINEGNLTLKNAALMRIVAKWCEQLRENFKNPYQIARKHDQFRMIDGSQRYLSHQQAEALEVLLERREQKIKDWQHEVRKNNFKHQQMFSKKNIAKDPEFAMLSQESTVGMFAALNSRNYEFYLISYLKELIHHSLGVMNEFQCLWYLLTFSLDLVKVQKTSIQKQIRTGKNIKKKFDKSSSIDSSSKKISLITFKIGDLMRCKCSSKQKEINALYNEIYRVSKQKPNFLKIVKIKNRLEKGTKDVLLNLLFEDRVLVEIQLAIDTGKNKFIECSNKFNHYIYEVERAQFGPLSELCSIWMNKDPRSDYFQKRFEAEHHPKFQLKQQKKADPVKICFPFQCQNKKCNRYGVNLLDNENSDKYCMLCMLENKEYSQMKKEFPKLPTFQMNEEQVKRIKFEEKIDIPNSGLVMNLKTKNKQVQYFKCIKRGKRKFLMIKGDEDKYRKIGEVTTKKQEQLFLQDNLVFSHASFQQKMKEIEDKQFIKNYFVPEIFKVIKKQQKTSIRIINDELRDEQILNSNEEIYNFVQSVNLSENNLTNLELITFKFPNVKTLILNKNQFQRIDVKEELDRLQQFNCQNNKIQEITERSIENFKYLSRLQVSGNKLQYLPSNFGSLLNVKIIDLSENRLSKLPSSFTYLSNLQKVDLRDNKLSFLPKSLGTLKNLKKLDLRENRLSELPKSFQSLYQMQQLDLSFNNIFELPEEIGQLKQLKQLILNNNELVSLPESVGKLKKLERLQIHKNKFNILPLSITSAESLKFLIADPETNEQSEQVINELRNQGVNVYLLM